MSFPPIPQQDASYPSCEYGVPAMTLSFALQATPAQLQNVGQRPCGRPRLWGAPCCPLHLTKEQAEAERAKRPSAYDIRIAFADGPQSEPACWSWEVPAMLPVFSDEDAAEQDLSDWHQWMCAICASMYPEVTDHDHRTGLVRGNLCRSCNVREGRSEGVLYDNYRMRNPAGMLGIHAAYFDPWHGMAQPEPVLTADQQRAQERAMRDLVDRLPIVLPPSAEQEATDAPS